MVREFLIRPMPFHDENLKSYLIRLALANNLNSVNQIYRTVGLKSGSWPTNLNMITNHDIPLDQLSNFTAIEKSDLISLTFFDVFGKYLDTRPNEVNTIFRLGMKTKYFQLCPLCLKEKQYLRKRWDLGFYTCCHIHNCLMINKCPGCNKNLSIRNSLVFICKCGYELKTAPVTFIPNHETQLSKLLSDKLNNYNKERSNLNNLFIKMDLLSIIYVLLLITLKVYKYEFNERFKFSNENINNIHQVAIYTFSIFTDWPNSFLEFIEEFKEIPKNQKNINNGIVKDFGTFYTLFYKQLKGNEYNELRNQFENYLISKSNDGLMYSRFIMNLCSKENRIFLTGDEAIKELGISYSRLLELIKEHQIEGKILPGKIKNQVLVRIESIEKYKDERNRIVTLNDVSIILGISKRLVRILFVEGVIPVISKPGINNKKYWNVYMESVEDLMAAFRKNQIYVEFDEQTAMKFNQVLKLFRGISVVNLIRSVMDSKINTIKIGDTEDLNSYAFLKKDIYTIIEEQEAKHVIYTHDIAREFGVIQDTVFEWIEKGLLTAEKIESVYIIRPQGLVNFQNKYISLFQVTLYQERNEKEYHKATLKNLMQFGIFPIHTYKENYLFSLYLKDEVIQYLNNEREQIYYTLEETSAVLQMGLANIYTLVKRGLLKELRVNKCRLIHIETIQSFQREFIWISRLSKLLDLQDSYIYKYLKNKDVQPYGADDVRPFVYEREKIINCLLNNPIRGKLINLEYLEQL